MIKRKIKYYLHDKKCNFKQYGNWTDLKSAEEIHMQPGEFKIIKLGISMKIPKGYELNIVPRSGLYKNYGILQTNSFGVIDEKFSGMGDIISFPALSIKHTVHISQYDRICQFRINLSQNATIWQKITHLFSNIIFEEVDLLYDTNRGGFGSSGK